MAYFPEAQRYYIVAGREAQVYSTQDNAFYALSDAPYQAWLKSNIVQTLQAKDILSIINARYVSQISALELKQPRMLREAALGDDEPGAITRLQTLNDQIEEVRAQMLSALPA